MLKNIPKVISPDMIKVLMEMGHGDEIIIADGNFPSASCAQRLIRCDGHDVPEILDAILKFFPLDTYSEFPASVMEVVPGDPTKPTIWLEYKDIIKKHDTNFVNLGYIERFDFYDRSKKAFAVIATSEKAIYANIILTKGIVTED